jgi:hypothetical protein
MVCTEINDDDRTAQDAATTSQPQQQQPRQQSVVATTAQGRSTSYKPTKALRAYEKKECLRGASDERHNDDDAMMDRSCAASSHDNMDRSCVCPL